MGSFIFNVAYDKMGEAMEEAGGGPGLLHCSVCGRREQMDTGDSADYLRNGWPMCHDLTMTLFTAAQVAAGEAPR